MIINRTNLSIFAKFIQICNLGFGRVKFPLPDLGEKIKEGTVKKLYVNEGDRV